MKIIYYSVDVQEDNLKNVTFQNAFGNYIYITQICLNMSRGYILQPFQYYSTEMFDRI
jgi:hypothetical protein